MGGGREGLTGLPTKTKVALKAVSEGQSAAQTH